MVSLFLLSFLVVSCEIALPPKRTSELDPRFLAQWVREGAWAGSGGIQRKGGRALGGECRCTMITFTPTPSFAPHSIARIPPLAASTSLRRLASRRATSSRVQHLAPTQRHPVRDAGSAPRQTRSSHSGCTPTTLPSHAQRQSRSLERPYSQPDCCWLWHPQPRPELSHARFLQQHPKYANGSMSPGDNHLDIHRAGEGLDRGTSPRRKQRPKNAPA